jgi:hypothetical protein
MKIAPPCANLPQRQGVGQERQPASIETPHPQELHLGIGIACACHRSPALLQRVRAPGYIDASIKELPVADIELVFPRWAQTVGALRDSQAIVRSQCVRCGIQQRVDLDVATICFGGGASLVGRNDRCSVVACNGTIFYLAAHTYGRQWIDLSAGSCDTTATPARNALSFDIRTSSG